MSLSKKDFFQDKSFGWSGLGTFIFSNCLILLSCGISLAWGFYRTRKLAVEADTGNSSESIILVPGLSILRNKLTDEFKVRLHRAALIYQDRVLEKPKPIIIVSGGITGENSISEAAAGAAYLVTLNVTKADITLEDKSRHTLENMYQARKLIGAQTAMIITSRYHLRRSITLARGLGMQVQPVAAENVFIPGWQSNRLMLKEAYYLHWYWSGWLWQRLTTKNAVI